MSKSLVNSSQLTELLNTINSKITHNSWDTVIHQTNILIDGNPKTIISYLNNNLEYDATTTDIQLNESNVLEVLLLVYTAFKCEYASFVRDLLNFFFEYISICETSVNTRSTINVADGCSHKIIIAKFIGFKQNIGKIIFNLFNFMDLSQHLILSDQTFLKSLISINLFLYYHQHLTDDDESTNINATYYSDYRTGRIIVLKKVVVQIKDLVDHFHCKNCFVGYDYFNDTKNNTSDLSTKIQELNDSYSLTSKMDRFDDIGLQNDLYDVEMYDPKYLLVTELFEIDKDYFEYILALFYKNTHNSYDINVIFQYQGYINEAVTIFFTRTFRKSLGLFIKKLGIDCNIPETLLSDSYRLLVEKKDSLTAALPDSEKVDLSKKKDLLPVDRKTFFSTLSYLDQRDLSVNILKLLNSKMPDYPYPPDSKEEIDIFAMTSFVINIVNCVHFKSFLHTFEIFKQESNSNDDYNLLTMDAHGKIEKPVDGVEGIDTASCKATAVLREILVSISLLVNVVEKHGMCIKGDDTTAKEQCFQGKLRLHLNSVFQCISNLIESTTDEKLQQRLWPILFHLENMGWTYLGVNDDEAYTQHVTIHQYVLMTLSSIEHYELSNCKSPIYNQTLYDKMVVYADIKSNHKEKSSVDTTEDVVDRLRVYIAFNTLKYNHVSYSSITYIHNSMFNEILSYFPEIYSKNYQFYWYGHKKNIYHIVQAVTQNVIDFHAISSYQLIIIQWIISTVYIRMKSLLKICHPLNKTDISIVKNQLFVIREEFNAPEALKKDFNDTVDRYLRVIATTNTFDLEVKNFDDFIIKKFELFDFAAIEAELTPENVCSGLNEYFEIIKSKLIWMSNNYNNYNIDESL